MLRSIGKWHGMKVCIFHEISLPTSVPIILQSSRSAREALRRIKKEHGLRGAKFQRISMHSLGSCVFVSNIQYLPNTRIPLLAGASNYAPTDSYVARARELSFSRLTCLIFSPGKLYCCSVRVRNFWLFHFGASAPSCRV